MLNHSKLGIAPIGWTNDDDPSLGADISFEQCIQDMHLAGYVGCEVGSQFPRNPLDLHAALHPLGLTIASACFSTYFTVGGKSDLTVERFVEHMQFLKAMGSEVIVVCESGFSIQSTEQGILGDNKPRFTSPQWQRLFSGLDRIGTIARENDMHVVYHQHMGTGVQTAEELAHLMDHTDKELVALLLDTGHIALSGEQPISYIQRYSGRIKHVHLKDYRESVRIKVQEEKMCFLEAVRAGIFTVPGDGSIDFFPIFKALSAVNYQGWLIVGAEQDPVKAPPLQYAKQARQYIHEMTGL